MRILPSILASLAMMSLPASAGINFVANFEAGSKWYTETWSAAARAEMEAFLSSLGALFDSDATVRVSITDNATSAYASAASSWTQWYAHPQTGGMVSAPGLWWIVVKGIGRPEAASDVTLNWNLNVASLYGGNSASLINNIRGLGRHEMHHAFGSVSYLVHKTDDDMRGWEAQITLADTFYRDVNDNLLVRVSPSSPYPYLHIVNDFVLDPNWATASNQSGLYFEARDIQGRVVKMPPISGGGSIDFSHIKGIAYVGDHPTWSTYVATDLNFLRALGYPLMVDSALRSQPATVTAFDFSGANAAITSQSANNRHYRLATSTDLRHWSVSPVGKPGTGSPLGFTCPVNKATEPKRFFQVVEVSP